MKILIGHDTYPPDVNGAARFTERLATGLVARGHEVHLIAPSHTGREFVEDRDGVVVHRLPSHRYPLVDQFMICMPWQAGPRIKRILDEVQPDVAHIQGHMLIGRLLSKQATERGLPLVATNHFMPENLVELVKIPHRARRAVSRLAWKDCANILGRAQVVTAPTPRAVELLAGSAGLPGGLAISCGIDPEPYLAASCAAKHDRHLRVLFVGRLDQEKRVNELIRAFARLPKDLDVRLEIVGDGSFADQWKALAGSEGVADRTTFLGFVSEEELLAAYGRCDVFCMPGVAELQSLVTLESMAAGKPVVAANAMALPHLVHPDENGFLYTPGDVDELATHLGRLLSDPDLRRRMGAASREIVHQHALNATLGRFEELYREVSGGQVVPLRKAA
ncbi:glycosyltransferase [Naumannella sp. ID2617S]|nr:glycosyltransferase [Naumannella sp. ID2617S]